MATTPAKKYYGPEYEARVKADLKAKAEKKAAKKKAREEKRTARKTASKERREASKKRKPITTAVKKAPKYKGAPEAPKVSKLGKQAKAKKEKAAADKSWSKATKARKAAGGPNLSTLVKARGMHEKGSAEYAKIQNKINEAYGVKKRHGVEKKQLGGMVEPPTSPSMQSGAPAYEEGGKVDANNPYGWPTRDARSGLSKKK